MQKYLVPTLMSVLFVFALSCLNTSVSSKGMTALIRKRATFDLNCPQERLQTVYLGGTWYTGASFGVTGCNARSTYIVICGSTEMNSCSVIMNNGTTLAQPR